MNVSTPSLALEYMYENWEPTGRIRPLFGVRGPVFKHIIRKFNSKSWEGKGFHILYHRRIISDEETFIKMDLWRNMDMETGNRYIFSVVRHISGD